MRLVFCPKCKTLMVPVKRSGRTVFKCSKCGYEEEPEASSLEAYRERSEVRRGEGVMVVEREGELLPKTRARCRRCGNEEAYYWLQQTRAADEPPTRFYRCTKCGYTWREYE